MFASVVVLAIKYPTNNNKNDTWQEKYYIITVFLHFVCVCAGWEKWGRFDMDLRVSWNETQQQEFVRGMDIPDKLFDNLLYFLSLYLICFCVPLVLLWMECCTAYLSSHNQWIFFCSIASALFDILETSHERKWFLNDEFKEFEFYQGH